MLSNKYLYNMKPKSFFSSIFASLRIDSIIKRKISIAKILCLTISRLGYEFVIHVENEYDYRYSSMKFRFVIISTFL